MLIDTEAVATIAVRDLIKAREFYEGKLEFELAEEPNDMVLTYRSGSSRLLVYKSHLAGGYDATVATWPMSNGLEKVVSALRAKGVKFEHYDDMPDTRLEGDIHVSGSMKCAWFKDPEGNILCLVQHPSNH